jgi:hypothetical protein
LKLADSREDFPKYKLSYDALCPAAAGTRRVFAQES